MKYQRPVRTSHYVSMLISFLVLKICKIVFISYLTCKNGFRSYWKITLVFNSCDLMLRIERESTILDLLCSAMPHIFKEGNTCSPSIVQLMIGSPLPFPPRSPTLLTCVKIIVCVFDSFGSAVIYFCR